MEDLIVKKRQHGVVLIVALIMVVAATAVVVALMSSSNIDIKITNAAQEREVAEQKLMGELQRVIAHESAQGENNRFLYSGDEISQNTSSKLGMRIAENEGMVSNLIHLNQGIMGLECPRRFNFTAGISCNFVQVSTTINYGSKNKHHLTLVTGIAQEMVNLSKGQ